MDDRDRALKAEAERDALMAAMEPLLVHIEPYRYAQRQEIERLVEEKKAWATRHNATCGNSNEMWFYATEFRGLLERSIEPLTRAVAEANEVFDRVSAAKVDRPRKANHCQWCGRILPSGRSYICLLCEESIYPEDEEQP